MLQKQILQKVWSKKPFNTKPKVYLAGPMEFVTDHGTGWRNEIEIKLLKNGFEVFNPANEVKLFKELKKSKELQADIDGQHIQFTKIIRDDLKEVITSDVILCRWFEGVFSAGTSGELTVAKLFNIPVLIICDDVKTLPKWILGCVTKTDTSFKNVVKQLRSIIGDK